MNVGFNLPLEQAYDSRYANVKMCNPYVRPTGQFFKFPRRNTDEKRRREDFGIQRKGRCFKICSAIWKHTFAVWEEWIVLFVMAIIIAIISFLMDKAVMACVNARLWLFKDIATQPFEKYVAWISLPIVLILFSHGWICILAPQAGGSGLPEMKTILCGVELRDQLTWRALPAKVAGAVATVGSGMPLGKKGPLIHVAAVATRLLQVLAARLRGLPPSDTRAPELLAAACAVGVACTFYAPIAGVLMSIELTTAYYPTRNYWRCFFAAVAGATFYKLLYVWNNDMDTVTPNFKTAFTMDAPFHPNELLVFGLMGAVCGVFGALYVWTHRAYATFLKTNKVTSYVMTHYRFVYPGLVAWGIASLLYPPGLGQFIAGALPHAGHVNALFAGFAWTGPNLTVQQLQVVAQWTTPYTGVYINLLVFMGYNFIFSIIASTIPVPSGCFMPVFKVGAAFGRIVGEAMHLWWLGGVPYAHGGGRILPGGYALVGAASFAAAVSRTVSVAVLAFEMTGQVTHAVPALIAVLAANGVASLVAPGMFDSIIVVKRLPYLPELLPGDSAMYNVFVEDFMIRDVKFVHNGMSYAELKTLLTENRKVQRFPQVDSEGVLLGAVHRLDLIDAVDAQVGRARRLLVAAARQQMARFHIGDGRETGESRGLFHAYEDGETKDGTDKGSSQNMTACLGLESFTEIDPKHVVTTRSKRPKTRIQRAMKVLLSRRPPYDRGEEWKDQMIESNRYRARLVPIDDIMLGRSLNPLKYVKDMTPEERKAWESEQLKQPVDFSTCRLDPAPFQLVVGTSLLKVHSFFSMVGINVAYVTSRSKLVGVVGVRELTKAIQDVNNNKLPTSMLNRSSPFPVRVPKIGHDKVNKIRMDKADKSVGDGKEEEV